MRNPIRSGARLLALLAIVLGNASCSDNPLTPQELSAQQISQLEQMLGSISLKLDSIDSRIDEQTEVFEARMDSLEAAFGVDGGGVDTVSFTGSLAALEAVSDSIMDLASYLAEDASSAGFEICGGIELAGEIEHSQKLEGLGRAAGDLGAWAGTGAFAGVLGRFITKLDGKVKVGVPIGIGGCLPLAAGAPPVRTASFGPAARSPESDALRTTLLDMGNQFNLDAATLPQALSNIAGTIQSPGSFQVQDVAANLPLPSGLATLTSDPVATITSRFQGLSNQAVDLLCAGTNWGTNVSTVVNDACALFPAGLPNVSAFASMSTQFPVLQNVVTSVCGRLDTMGTRSLVIPSYSVNFGGVVGTWTVFPGYNQRLFPSYTTPC